MLFKRYCFILPINPHLAQPAQPQNIRDLYPASPRTAFVTSGTALATPPGRRPLAGSRSPRPIGSQRRAARPAAGHAHRSRPRPPTLAWLPLDQRGKSGAARPGWDVGTSRVGSGSVQVEPREEFQEMMLGLIEAKRGHCKQFTPGCVPGPV